MEPIQFTRSKMHDKVRELAFSENLEAELIDWLDGKILADGRPYRGATPHQRVSKLGGQTHHQLRNISIIGDRYRDELAEIQKLKQFATHPRSWDSPEDIKVEQRNPGPVDFEPEVVEAKDEPNLSRKQMRQMLKENGIDYGGRSSNETLMQKLKENGLI